MGITVSSACERPLSPVDAGGVHEVRDVSAGLLDLLEAPLDLLLVGDVAAQSHVAACGAPEAVKVT